MVRHSLPIREEFPEPLPGREEFPESLGDLQHVWHEEPAPPEEPPTDKAPEVVDTQEIRFSKDRVLATVVIAVEKRKKDGTWKKFTEVNFPNLPVMADMDAEELEFGVSLERLLENCRIQAPHEWAKAMGGGS